MGSTVGQKVISVFSTLLVVALLTTLVLPGRDTPTVIEAFFNGLASAVSALIGK